MAIRRREQEPTPRPTVASSAEVDFINAAHEKNTPTKRQVSSTGRKKQFGLKFEPAFMERVDRAAKDAGIDRTAWITFKLNEALKSGGF
ncbi:MAG: hypothetical protein GDA50_08895 [Alphaproteobacteria bacterium GM202ARS2]|nr:hypothetical protein [Alphaproteobacteria bacterium GM202ARS2]